MFELYFQATWEESGVQEWKTPIYRRPRFTAAFSMFQRAAVNRGFTVVTFRFLSKVIVSLLCFKVVLLLVNVIFDK